MRRRLIVLVLLFLATLLAGCGADDDPVVDGAATTDAPTTTSTPTSTPPTSTTTTGAAPSESPGDLAVWPVERSSTRYRDPVEAARGFAVELAGFRQPVMGMFRAGDARSGEVELRASARGPATTVLVRQLGADDSWWVVASTTPNIELETPARGATVTSPLRLTGRARAFEGTVQVALREEGTADPVATGFVTGSGGGELGPFEGEIPFRRRPAGSRGVLMLFTESAENGQVWEVAALPVRLSAG